MSSAKRLNILFILTDQQRFDTIGACGNPDIETPNLDRLVGEGIHFTQAFSPSPVCVPARACIQYGQYPGKTKCWGNAFPMPEDGRPSYVELLTQAGYDTVGIGKCHFTPDRGALRGFQERWSQEESPAAIAGDSYLQFLQASPFHQVRDIHGAWREQLYLPQTSPLPESHHPSQWVADRTIDFIQQKSHEAERPWFAYCSFIQPHPPFSPPYSWSRHYDPDDLPDPYLPEGYETRQPVFKQRQLYGYYMDPPTSPTLWRAMKASYYACISFVDAQVGRLLETLEASRQLENTLIVFSSDHGELLGDWGMIGKELMYDPSAKVPLIIRPPGAKHTAGLSCSTAVSLVDIPATILNAAQVDKPEGFDGEDLLAIARQPDPERIVFSQVFPAATGLYMSVSGRYKYTYNAPDNLEELFDLEEDPREAHNLVDDASQAETLETLRSALFDYLIDTGQSDVLDFATRTWIRQPERVPTAQRSQSNHPVRWASELERES